MLYLGKVLPSPGLRVSISTPMAKIRTELGLAYEEENSAERRAADCSLLLADEQCCQRQVGPFRQNLVK